MTLATPDTLSCGSDGRDGMTVAACGEARSDMGDSTGELRLTDVVGFFRRNLRLIAGFVLASGIVASVVLLLVVRKQYEASVTLVIVPPKLASELKPQSLSVQSYQQMLESDAVLAETRKRLLQKGFSPSRMDFQIGRALRTKIFVSRVREDIALAPMLQAVVHAKSPEEAAATANIWADVFLNRSSSWAPRGARAATSASIVAARVDSSW